MKVNGDLTFGDGTAQRTAAPASTTGLGLPATTGRNAGDMHYDIITQRQFELVLVSGALAWVSSAGSLNTAGSGLPTFNGRVVGDHAFDTAAGKDYVLTGAAAGLASAALVGGVVNTPAQQVLDLGTATGATSISCRVNNDTASDGVRIYFEGNNANPGLWTQGYFYDIIGSSVKIYPYNGGSPLAVGSLPAGISVGSPNSYDLTIDNNAGHVVVKVNSIVVLDANITPVSGRYISVEPSAATPAISVTNFIATKAGTLGWTPASSGPTSTVGFGLPSTTGRSAGDLHYDRSGQREYTLVSASGTLTWVPTSGAVNTVAAGLPTFIGRALGDHAYDTAAAKDYVLTGTAGITVADGFDRTTLGTTDQGGKAWLTCNFPGGTTGTGLVIVSNRLQGTSGDNNCSGFDMGTIYPLEMQVDLIDGGGTGNHAAPFFFVFGAASQSSTATTGFWRFDWASGSTAGSRSLSLKGPDGVVTTLANQPFPSQSSQSLRIAISSDGLTARAYVAGTLVLTATSASAPTGTWFKAVIQNSSPDFVQFDNLLLSASGTLTWTPSSSGPTSTTGFGLPTTIGRNAGDLHFERFSNREYVFAGGVWTASSGAVNTASSGLPPFTGRVTGDHHFDTASHRDYVLTGVVGAQVGDSFNRATFGTTADTGQTYFPGLGSNVPVLDGTKWLGSGSATLDYSNFQVDLGTSFGTVQADYYRGQASSQLTFRVGTSAARPGSGMWRVNIGGVLFVTDPSGATLLSENPSSQHAVGARHTWTFSVAADGVTWTLSRDGVVYASGTGAAATAGTRVQVDFDTSNNTDWVDNFQAFSPGSLVWNLAQSSAETIKHIAASGAAVTVDDPLATGTTITRAVLSANCTFTLPAPATAGSTVGKSFTVIAVQAASGGPYTATFTVPSGNVLWGAAGAPTQSTGASKGDMYIFTDAGGGNLLGTYVQGF